MEVSKLLKNVNVKSVVDYRETDISSVAADSRDVCENALFVCLKGEKADGHDYASQAKLKGAVALVTERELNIDLPQFVVDDARAALAQIAGNFYDNPASKLKVVTIVGTNGKTSTAEILSGIFEFAGYPSATIGTLGYKIGTERTEGYLTTPDPIDLHRELSEMVERGVKYVFIEASAHAIYYEKLAGIKANASIFTNITQDHLDFFGTMERYASIKTSYFSRENTALAIVNSDDPKGRELINNPAVPTIAYGIDNPADVFAINIKEEADGLSFMINAFDRIEEIHTTLFGRFNVYNIMAATASAMYFGISLPVITGALRAIPTVPGRFQVKYLGGKRVVLDYAHTPDGLENLLTDLAKDKGRLITVFGCGGNRDRTKRPKMGEIASRYSDYVIITNDNPRFEEAEEIAKEIRAGISADNCEIILDREQAIRRAFQIAISGDTIAIAGKGHERYMEIKGRKIPYNDEAILEKYNR